MINEKLAEKGFARSYRINLRSLPELAFSSGHDARFSRVSRGLAQYHRLSASLQQAREEYRKALSPSPPWSPANQPCRIRQCQASPYCWGRLRFRSATANGNRKHHTTYYIIVHVVLSFVQTHSLESIPITTIIINTTAHPAFPLSPCAPWSSNALQPSGSKSPSIRQLPTCFGSSFPLLISTFSVRSGET